MTGTFFGVLPSSLVGMISMRDIGDRDFNVFHANRWLCNSSAIVKISVNRVFLKKCEVFSEKIYICLIYFRVAFPHFISGNRMNTFNQLYCRSISRVFNK